MFDFNRNQIIVTVLVFMIAIAGYLQLSGTNPYVSPQVAELQNESMFIDMEGNNLEEGIDLLGFTPGAIETLAPDSEDGVFSDEFTEVDVVITKSNSLSPAKEVMVTDASLGSEYFIQEKMLRDQARASQIDELTQYVASEEVDSETKAKAAETLVLIQERIEKENGAESLLRAKGFEEVFVRISENSVDVVINKSELSNEEIAQIEEIVQRKTGYSFSKINIHINTQS